MDLDGLRNVLEVLKFQGFDAVASPGRRAVSPSPSTKGAKMPPGPYVPYVLYGQ
jgi:hypothetical protein